MLLLMYKLVLASTWKVMAFIFSNVVYFQKL